MRDFIVIAKYKLPGGRPEIVSSHTTQDNAEKTIMDIKLGKTDFLEDPVYLAKLKRY